MMIVAGNYQRWSPLHKYMMSSMIVSRVSLTIDAMQGWSIKSLYAMYMAQLNIAWRDSELCYEVWWPRDDFIR